MTIENKAKLAEPGPVYICHGATGDQRHFLKIMPADDSPWTNQQVSRYDDGEQVLPIDVIPAADEYQPFLPEGAKFEVHCPAGGTDADLKLWLRSEFTAEPYGIDLRLGDYRRAIVSNWLPDDFPQWGVPVKAEITVGSFYISGRLLAAVDVEWLLDGKLVQTVPTDGTGKSTVSISGIKLGEHTITASVYSEYDDSKATHDFTINVISESPWKDATVEINGKPAPVDQSIWLPRGKSDNTVKLTAPLFAGRTVLLNAVDSDGLNITAQPLFGSWVPLGTDGVAEWTLAQDEAKSGRLKLVFLSRDVTPTLELDCRVISDNLADEVDVKIHGNPVPALGNWFIRDIPQKVTATLKPGSPIAGLQMALKCTVNSPLIEGDVTSAPAFNTQQTQYEWSVTGHYRSGTFQLSLEVRDLTSILLPVSKLLSTNLADEAEVKIGGEVVPPEGVIFTLEEPQVVTLGLKANSPLAGHPVKLTYTIIDGDLSLNSEPPFDGYQTDHRWTVTGVSGAGTFRLSLAGESMTQELDAPNCKLQSEQPSLRFYFAPSGTYAPLPPEVTNLSAKWWHSVDLRLMHADGSPIAGATVTMYRPEQETISGRTKLDGVLLGFPAYQYTTPGPRTFEAVATLPSGEVRASYLINVLP